MITSIKNSIDRDEAVKRTGEVALCKNRVIELLLQGLSNQEIWEISRKDRWSWNNDIIADAFKAARNDMIKKYNDEADSMVYRSFSRYDDLYRQSYNLQDFKECLNVQKKLEDFLDKFGSKHSDVKQLKNMELITKFNNLPKTKIYFEIAGNNYDKLLVFQGGARCSKTYSILQYLIWTALTSENEVISIYRKTLPSLKKSVLRDFLEILDKLQMYDDKSFNKTDLTYKIGTNLIEFCSLDSSSKVRGAKRTILFLNEVTEIDSESWSQLLMRTTKRIIMDYNPSDPYHWVLELPKRDDCFFHKSSYLDNPYLEQTVKEELEKLKELDEELWRVYGLGEVGSITDLVYPNIKYFKNLSNPPQDTFYGLDFGYNNPTSLVRVDVLDDMYYVTEVLYKSGLTNTNLIDTLERENINKHHTIYCDSAEPARIAELTSHGFFAVKAVKDVRNGIMALKQCRWFVQEQSDNLIKELRAYKYKKLNDLTTEEPVKFNDHAVDALRYAIHSHLKGSPNMKF